MPMKKLEKMVLLVSSVSHGLCHIYLLLFAGALVPITESFESSFTAITTIGSMSYLLFGLGALPSGLLIARANAKLTLRLFYGLSALACILTGISGSLVVFAVGLCFIGLFGSLYHVSGLTLIAHCFQERGKALGIHGVGGSAGVALAPLVAGVIVSLLGWREAYLIAAVPGVAGFFYLSFEKRIPEAHVKISRDPQPKDSGSLPFFALAVVAMGLNGFIYRGFLTMFPTYIAQSISLQNISPVLTGGVISSLILSVGMIGQFCGGFLSDKIKLTTLYLIVIAVAVPFLVIMGFTSGYLLVVASVAFTVFHFSGQPVENHIISARTPARLVSSVFGVKLIFTFGVGSFAAAFAGLITDSYGIGRVFPLLGVILLIPIIIASVLRRMDRKAVNS